jgi:hypothetical protein
MRRAYALICIFLTGCTTPLVRDNLRPPVTVPEIAGDWVGHDCTGMYFYDLDLGLNGQGRFGSVYDTRNVSQYLIKAWTVSNNRISITLEEVTPGDQPITVVGETRGAYITATIRGNGWQRTAVLIRKQTVQNAMQMLENTTRPEN